MAVAYQDPNAKKKKKKTPVLQDYPRSPKSIPTMHDVPSIADSKRLGGHPPGGLKPGKNAGAGISLKDIPLQKPVTTGGKTGGAHPPGGLRPAAKPKNVPRTYAKPGTPDNKPMGMSFTGTQVKTNKGSYTELAYKPNKTDTVQKRGAVTTSVAQNVMDVRMNNQRTIRGKLRDSRGGRG